MFVRKKIIYGFDYIDVLFIAGKRARAKTSMRAPCLCGHSLHADLELREPNGNKHFLMKIKW